LKTKDVEINNNRYQLRKLDALVASWILNLLVVTSSKLPKPDSDVTVEQREEMEAAMDSMKAEDRGRQMIKFLWAIAGAELDEERYRKIQLHALRVCSWVSPAGNSPVIMADGRITVPALDDNPMSLTQLIGESLEFNLSVFFQGDALKADSKDTASQPLNASK
jgi:hypothetical protein